jgi:hypothetical protein
VSERVSVSGWWGREGEEGRRAVEDDSEENSVDVDLLISCWACLPACFDHLCWNRDLRWLVYVMWCDVIYREMAFTWILRGRRREIRGLWIRSRVLGLEVLGA